VYIECGWDPADLLGELRWVQAIADTHGFPHGIVAFARLEDPDLGPVLDSYIEFPNIRGIRQTLNWHADPHLSVAARSDLIQDAGWQRGLDLLTRYGLSFELSVYPGQLVQAASLAAHHPNARLILNHAGMPADRDAAGLETWRRGIRAIAAQPNVAVKISGLGMFDHSWTRDSIRPFVLDTIDAFGAERCMFASNFPVDRLYGSYGTLFRAFRDIVATFSEDEQRRLFFANAVNTYRL
jgi:predicted TIM-barrel fold metal-dependent hydrolase